MNNEGITFSQLAKKSPYEKPNNDANLIGLFFVSWC